MDTAQWPQDILVRAMDEIVANKSSSVERKVRPQKEQAVNCPRCNSINTKFCYYNNYSLSQPRYFCKTCRRYWTEGGSLRNIPVGGGSRKNKRSSSSSNSSKKLPDLVPPQQNPNINEPQDLNLGIYSTTPHHPHQLIQLQDFDHHHQNNNNNKDMQINPSSSSPTALELLTGISSTTRGLSSFMSMQMNHDPNSTNVYAPASSLGFPLPEFRPSLNFSLDGLGSNYGSFQGVEGSNGKQLLFPFEDLKQVSSSTNNNTNDANDGDHQENGEHNGAVADSTGYWNGVIGGGSW